MIIFSLLLYALLLFAPRKEAFTFDLSNTALLKAILPFFIILGHAAHAVKSSLFDGLGVYVVALFFFVSGYGLEYKRSVDSKDSKDSMHLLVNRIVKLLFPLVVPIIIYVGVRWASEGIGFSFIYQSIRSYEIILPYSWFIISLVQMYILYYVSHYIHLKYLKGEGFLVLLSVVITLYIAILYSLHIQSTYYCSLYGFLAGVLFRYYEPIIKKIKFKSLLASVLLLSSIVIMIMKLPCTMLYNSWIFCFACALIISLITLKGRIIDFFSKISYEMYICQGIGIYLSRMLVDKYVCVGGVNSCFVVWHSL